MIQIVVQLFLLKGKRASDAARFNEAPHMASYYDHTPPHGVERGLSC